MRQRAEGIWLVCVVGIAAAVATAVWSVASAVWLDRLPFRDPDRLVSLGWTEERHNQRIPQTSIEEFEDLKRTTGDLFELAAWENDLRWYLRVGDRPVEITGAGATSNLLEVLGVQPALGRTFRPDDAQAGGTVAVISHGLWATAFNRDPDVIGREVAVTVNAAVRGVRIVGVLPESGAVRRADAREITMLVATPDGSRLDGARSSRRAYTRVLIARLKAGVTPEIAASRTTPVFREIDRVTGLFVRTRTASVVGLHEHWFGRSKPFLVLLAAASVFLLLVATANGSGIMLALSSRRAREMAVRVAIGAGRRHLAAQALREAAVIGAGAAAVSVVAAAGMIRLFIEWGPANVPRLSDASLNWTAMVFAAAVTAGFCLTLGLTPALVRRRRDVLPMLQSGGTTSTVSRRTLRVRQVAIAVQLSIVLALLAAAGLVAGTLRHMLSQPLGFTLDHTVAARITPTQAYYKDPPTYARVMADARRAARSVPGVTAAALTVDPPLADQASNMRVAFLDQPAQFVGTKMVSDGFFGVMQIPILAGRDFDQSDMAAGDAVIVNELFARTYFGGIDKAIGREIDFANRQRVVGVVGNVREEGLTKPLRPIIYPVFSQRWTVGEFHVVVRYQGVGRVTEPQIDTAILRSDPTSHVEVLPLNNRVRVQTSIARTQSAAVGLLAVVALLLAGAGIYATIAQVVEDRQRELGIRAALGASGRSLIALTAASVATAALFGIAGGAALSWVVARVTRQFLFEMTPFDPVVWSVAAAVLLVTSGAAAWWPARRAALIEPAVVLRQG